MKYYMLVALFILSASQVFSQSRFSKQELSINGFRNPSIGAEYRYRQFSVHAGYYPTNFESGVTTEFIRTGITYWFLPVDKKETPSSFYASLSYARGMTREYKGKNSGMAEIGFRWMVYKGINVRLGVAALAAEGMELKINPTPGISYSFFF
jgi:hypothetical protein